MTTTPTRPENETEPDDAPRPRRRVLEISFVQLFAGALAAMTSALIGSRLGVSGTVIGAAVGSLVAGVTGSVYSASLQRGRQVIARAPIALKVAGSPTVVARSRPTAVLPAAAAVPPGSPTQATLAGGESRTRLAPRRRAWKPVLATAAAAFALAGLGITAIELATGQTLSGREGTTISQVSSGATGQQPLSQPPAEEPAEEAPPSEIPTEEVAQPDEPTEVPSTEGDPAETPSVPPSDIPSEEPSESPTESPTQEPSIPPTEEPSEAPTPAW